MDAEGDPATPQAQKTSTANEAMPAGESEVREHESTAPLASPESPPLPNVHPVTSPILPGDAEAIGEVLPRGFGVIGHQTGDQEAEHRRVQLSATPEHTGRPA